MRGILLLSMAICVSLLQLRAESPGTHALIEQGNAALAQGRVHDATAIFQHAVDLDPSSAKAHEQLGSTLARQIISGNLRPSAAADLVDRAEDHLKQAIEIAPFAVRPLIELSDLDAALAEHSDDDAEKSGRYKNAQDLLKKALALKPGEADLYLRLAKLERDEFSPAIQQASARSGKKSGPLADSALRHSLQQQYGSLVEDAITNARKASEINANSLQSMLLMSRLLKERALLRDTPEQYASDIQSAADWRRQFLINGGHTGSENTGTSH